MSVLLREATLADLEVLIHHRRRMFSEMGGDYEKSVELILASARAYFQTALCDGSYRGWLAQAQDGSIVAGGGLVIAAWPGFFAEKHPRRAWILNMYTEPAWRRQGIARHLLNTIVEWCRAEGFGSVSLHASVEGRPLYESVGFQPTNEMRLKL
jgi:GNAT superfamily N-acetyltransferase